jgi:hypothetical protein
MRYRLRTLLILLAVGPPLLAMTWVFVVKAVEAYRLPKYPDADLDVRLIQGTTTAGNPQEGFGFQSAP